MNILWFLAFFPTIWLCISESELNQEKRNHCRHLTQRKLHAGIGCIVSGGLRSQERSEKIRDSQSEEATTSPRLEGHSRGL